MTTPIPRGDGKNGTWRPFMDHTPDPEWRNYWTAHISCPKCGQRMTLTNHTIDGQGNVTPSIAHPTGVQECGWHPSDAQLVGWEEVVRLPLPPPPEIATCCRCSRQSRTVGGWGIGWGYAGYLCDVCIPQVVAEIEARGSAGNAGVRKD